MAKSGLGRGLAALLPEEEASPFQYLPVSDIRANPRQPRDRFAEAELEVLSDSIGRLGVLQPLIVRREGAGYELVAGERRLRAARMAGLDTVPALVKDVDEAGSLEQAMLENLHRQDLNPLEEAAAYSQLIEDFGLTHEAVAAKVGKSRAAITNTLRLLALPGAVQERLIVGDISGGHARALLALEDVAAQVDLAEDIVGEGLTVRQTEDRVRELSGRRRKSRASKAREPTHPALLEVADLMGEYLGTGVQLRMGKGAGRLVVRFGSLADLERITQLIVGPFDR